MNLYYCDIYDGVNLICRLVPCRKKDNNTLGLYDMINEKFLINQGTGTLECGPDVGETTDYKFGVLGKNKLDPNLCLLGTYWNSIQARPATSSWISVDYIQVSPGATYTITGSTVTSEAPTAKHLFYDANKQFVSSIPAGTTNQTFTVPDGCRYIRLSIKNDSLDGLQLELGSTATAYEPYDPKHTVYGGWVDLISGEITVTHEKTILNGDKAFGNPGDYDTFYRFVKNYSDLGLLEPKATQFPKSNWLKGQSSPNGIFIGSTKNVLLYLNKDLDISTKEALSTYLTEHPLEFTYELVTPIIYHIAPTALQTFLGYNNVWSNADYVEVEYDLHETQELL